MKTHKILSLLLVAFLFIGAGTETKVTVDDIIKLHNEGLGTDVIKSFIISSAQVFELVPDDLIKLKKAGVSEEVIKIMLETKKKTASDNNQNAAQPANPANPAGGKVVIIPANTGGAPTLTERLTGKKTGDTIIIEPDVPHIAKFDNVFFVAAYETKFLNIAPQRIIKIGQYDPLSNSAVRAGTFFLTEDAVQMYNDKGEKKFEVLYTEIRQIKIVNRYADDVEARYHPLDRYELRLEYDRGGKKMFSKLYTLPMQKDNGELEIDGVIKLAGAIYDQGKLKNPKLDPPKRIN